MFFFGIPKQRAQGSSSPKHLGIGIKFENETRCPLPMAGFEQCGDVGRHLCLVFLSGPNLLCLTVKACIQDISSIFKTPCFVEYSSYSWLPRPVSGDFIHAETGGIAGALIPPASYSGSGLGRTDLGRLGQKWGRCDGRKGSVQSSISVTAFSANSCERFSSYAILPGVF